MKDISIYEVGVGSGSTHEYQILNPDFSMSCSNHNLATEPHFPDIKEKGDGKHVILNTADNLAALLEFGGYEARVNQMSLEPEIFHQGECIGSPEVIRSRLISLSAIYSLPKSAIDDHLSAIAQDNTYHPVTSWLDEHCWDGIPRVDKG